MDCTSCEELRQVAPQFYRVGLTDTMRENLAENKGFEGKSDDCTDLNLANDCLIGRMPSVVDSYDNCDWKQWAKDFSSNVYNVMGGVIAWMCGMYFNAKAFVRHIRDMGEGGQTYMQTFNQGDSHIQSYYMDANHTNYGSKVADRDYVVVISHCFNVRWVKDFTGVISWFTSGDKRSMETIRREVGQHPTLNIKPNGEGVDLAAYAWTLSTAITVKKGEYIKSEIYCEDSIPTEGQSPIARIHQIAMTWIPANIGTEEV